MVRTGQRAGVLKAIFVAAGLKQGGDLPNPPRLQDMDADVREQVLDMYRSLGGAESFPHLRPGAWDMALADGRVVELDEELHFNRYRAATFRDLPLRSLPWCFAYETQCVAREPDCLRAGRWGKRWVNDSAAAMFGPAAEPGDLSAPSGAPRWKQRALYDAMKDMSTMQAPARSLIRLSVHDVIAGERLGAVLDQRAAIDPHDVAAFADIRSS
jgi:hypothetical protein